MERTKIITVFPDNWSGILAIILLRPLTLWLTGLFESSEMFPLGQVSECLS